jgi:hypothetical protein
MPNKSFQGTTGEVRWPACALVFAQQIAPPDPAAHPTTFLRVAKLNLFIVSKRIGALCADRFKFDKWCQYWYHNLVLDSNKILDQIRREPSNVRFRDLMKICKRYFGEPRQTGTSHTIFKTPWPGDPRINLQNYRGKAKTYQVKQVLLAIDKLQ